MLTFAEAFAGANEPRSLSPVVEAWDHDGLCRFRAVHIPITVDVQPGSGSYGGAHQQLKLSALAWLAGLGITDGEMERGYPAGVADVLSHSKRLAIECGHTSPRKIIHAVEHGFAVVMLPYTVGNWRCGDLAGALLVMSPRRRRGEEIVRAPMPPGQPTDSSARYLGI